VKIRDDDGAEDMFINLTPMIDITLNLLVFFMLVSKFSNTERELDLHLPEAESSTEPAPAPDEIVINVLADGRVSLGGREVTREALLETLQRAAQANPATPVKIRGDRLVHHENVVNVMDACGLAGLSNLAVGTLHPSGG